MDIAENYCASKNYRFCGIYDCSGSHHRFRKLRVIPHARTKDTLVCTLAAPHSQLSTGASGSVSSARLTCLLATPELMHASSVSCQSHFRTTGRCSHYFFLLSAVPVECPTPVAVVILGRHHTRRVLLAIASYSAVSHLYSPPASPPPSSSSTSCSPFYAPRFTSASSSTLS